METTICKLCLEPVTNFICPDCLLKDVKQWLHSKNQNDLSDGLQEEHEKIKEFLFSYKNFFHCIICKRFTEEAACPCCYTGEIFLWLKLKNPELAKEFEKIFSFDFNYHYGFTQLTLAQSLTKKLITDIKFKPVLISQRKNKIDMNICESCDNTSDYLQEVEGKFICEVCKDLI